MILIKEINKSCVHQTLSLALNGPLSTISASDIAVTMGFLQIQTQFCYNIDQMNHKQIARTVEEGFIEFKIIEI